MTFDPATRTADNALDVGRKWPTTDLAPKVLNTDEGTVTERITGPAGSATVVLSRPAKAIRDIQSFTTASGVASTGGGKKQFLTEDTDYTVNLENANGVCALTEKLGTNYSAETWVVTYSPLAAEGTIGGQSSA